MKFLLGQKKGVSSNEKKVTEVQRSNDDELTSMPITLKSSPLLSKIIRIELHSIIPSFYFFIYFLRSFFFEKRLSGKNIKFQTGRIIIVLFDKDIDPKNNITLRFQSISIMLLGRCCPISYLMDFRE